MATQSKRRESPETPEERLKSNVARGLAEVFPGFEIVDRELDLGEGRKVDWVGVDSTGRLIFALWAEADAVEPILAALDALAFAQRNRGVLSGHLQSHKLRPEVAPIVAMVAESFTDRQLQRYSGLNTESLRLLELRKLVSARGEFVHLAPIQPAPARAALIAARGHDVFLRTLSPSNKELAEVAIKRVARIDDQLTSSASERMITWRWNGELVGSLSSIDDRLDAQVQPEGHPLRIGSSQDIESFVDQALERYVELLGSPLRSVDAEPSLATPVEAQSLLSNEELEAFRQPS